MYARLEKSLGPECYPTYHCSTSPLTPTLSDEIITAKKNDEGMSHIKRRIREGDLSVTCFHEDAKGTLWFKERLVVPKKKC
jgi:hypothetical protein